MKRRRKRNKKKQAQGFVFPVPLALLLVLITVTSMSYLWMHGRCEAAGVRIQRLERHQLQARQQLLDEQAKWNQLRTLNQVRAAVARHRLDMELAPTHRVIRLARPPRLDEPISLGEWARLADTP